MEKLVAILTGDLIRSTQAPRQAVETAMSIIRNCAVQIAPDTNFTRFRGDGWQLRLNSPHDHLWASLLILARLRAEPQALGCRIAVGLGEQYEIDGQDLSTAMGPAFTASGRALDRMKPGLLLVLEYPDDYPRDLPGKYRKRFQRFRKLAYTLASHMVDHWTVEQAEAMAMKLDPTTPADERLSNEVIARTLRITRQAVDARLKAANYHLLEETIQAFLADQQDEEYPL